MIRYIGLPIRAVLAAIGIIMFAIVWLVVLVLGVLFFADASSLPVIPEMKGMLQWAWTGGE